MTTPLSQLLEELFQATYQGMADIEKQGADFCVQLVKNAEERKLRQRSCHRCRHFSVSQASPTQPAFYCKQWEDVVPADARDDGCDKFYLDEIPF